MFHDIRYVSFFRIACMTSACLACLTACGLLYKFQALGLYISMTAITTAAMFCASAAAYYFRLYVHFKKRRRVGYEVNNFDRQYLICCLSVLILSFALGCQLIKYLDLFVN